MSERRWTRREMLEIAVRSFGTAALVAPLGLACGEGRSSDGPLSPTADENGLRLPPGARSRVVAVSGEAVGPSGYFWHAAPDGGAVFDPGDGGWIYVSNSEIDRGSGGVGAIRFDASGNIIDAYPILTGTSRNCAGGATPWNTWLSCEEVAAGEVYECDPLTPFSQGAVRPALGVFRHEAVAVDSVGGQLYLTEDEVDGLVYRFTPTAYPSLGAGRLEALEILDPGGRGPIAPGEVRHIRWHDVPDPFARVAPTRRQVAAATPFRGGEGCDTALNAVFFTTKGDDRVWRIDIGNQTIEIVYDRATSSNPILSGADNLLARPNGDLLVAEDPGNLQIVALRASGLIEPVIELTGHLGSEITGPAVSPDGTRLYFSSQRLPGTTFEVTGAL